LDHVPENDALTKPNPSQPDTLRILSAVRAVLLASHLYSFWVLAALHPRVRRALARHAWGAVISGERPERRWPPFRAEASCYCRSELEQYEDGRWIAAVAALPEMRAYGVTETDAVAKVQALSLRVLADRLEHREATAVHCRCQIHDF